MVVAGGCWLRLGPGKRHAAADTVGTPLLFLGPAMPAHALLPAVNRLLQWVNLNEKREAQLEKDPYRVLLNN